jgi:glucan biosynthesis protein C
MNATPVSPSRRYDYDWLRVLLILAVFVFHSIHFFDPGYWHVKNATTYLSAAILMTFISRWLMPAIFIISGVATFYALGKREAGVFIKERTLRLLVPLVVGCFTHAAWQVYLERLNHNQFSGTFWQYYLSYFDGLDRLGGDFRWMGNHLWYLEVLFVFSLICLPLLIWMRQGAGKRVLTWLGDRLSAPGAVYLLMLPTLLLLVTLNPQTPGLLTSEDWGGWNLPNYLVFFLTGFLLASSQGMQASIRRMRWISLVAGVITFAAGGAFYVIQGDQLFGTPMYMLLISFSGVIGWTWILAIFGFGLVRLNVRTPVLDYANEAVLPFYILHQTILLTVGFYVVNWTIPDFVKWVIIAPVSFDISMALYELLVRRINLLRVLFGMKPVYQEKRLRNPAAQVS